MLDNKRDEDSLPVQWIYIRSRNMPALTMGYLKRLMLYSESMSIAHQLKEKTAPTSILFQILFRYNFDHRNS